MSVVRPVGSNIHDALYDGFAVCNDCGAIMDEEGSKYVCPGCGSTCEQDEYSYDGPEPDDDEMPEGCAACGGPWPDCTTSCEIYDD